MLLIDKKAVKSILEEKEIEITELIKETYILYAQGQCSLPNSVFLRFPQDERNRIIGLPAYVGGRIKSAGIKWISSFPNNIIRGMERASAIIALNDLETGTVDTLISGTDISAKRTAASAVEAAICLHNIDINEIGIIGCGRINLEILKFMIKRTNLKKIYLIDSDKTRIEKFVDDIGVDIDKEILDDYDELFQKVKVISVATNASVPYLNKMECISPEHTILGISLRDFTPEFIMSCSNIVDSIEHVNRENTSINMAYMKYNTLNFIKGEIGEIYMRGTYFRDEESPILFSPFGLGVLDISLGNYVKEIAIEEGNYCEVLDF